MNEPKKILIIPREDFEKNAKLDVSKWVKRKQGLDYIPWAISVGLLRQYNNTLYYEFATDENGRPYFRDPAAGIYLVVHLLDLVSGCTTPSLFYPVRGLGNKPCVDPTIDVIGNNMQRAVSKVIAQFAGLGWSLYSRIDESIDDEPATKQPLSYKVGTKKDDILNF